ncbi:MAG TPA: FAD-dependent oxidoreductase, partial [Thermodesulfobacteriota bacterium]|nr:FAD-dependent oxidoreductase [Thermodesulfobacteriota bacterium]
MSNEVMPTSLEGLPRCTSYTGFNPARRGARAVERFTMPSITKMKKDIVIVGGGVTGLAAAYYIQKNRTQQRAPIDVLLVEKENRLGGKIRTETADGFLIEGGPDCFISEKPAALRLSGELDLGS